MFAPVRAFVSSRRGAPVALLAAAGAVSMLFAATPFVIPEVAERFEVSLGTGGLISVAQVGAFAAVTFVAGRWWRPSRRLMVAAGLATIVVNAASVFAPTLALLLVLRVGAGGAAGVFTWLAWTDAMRSSPSMRDIAAVGPVTVMLGAPLLGWIVSLGDDRSLYALLTITPLAAMFIPTEFGDAERTVRRRMSPSRSNVLLMVALGVLTMAGSALFVFVGALASGEVGLSAVALSLGFSVNALAGLIGARWRSRPRWVWPWLAVITVSAWSVVAFPNPVVFYLGMFGWGFAFWMAVPGVLAAVAAWSFVPEERTGDAQALMAVGRALGPLVGGLLVGAGEFGRLGTFTGVGLASAAALVAAVEIYRSGRSSPRVS